jgi:23S rRNA pseudouridine2605 synthase
VITLLRTGIVLDDGLARPTNVEVRPPLRGSGRLRVVMTEGRKREVRRLFDAVGHPVVALKRIRFGPIRLEGLPVGEWSELTEDEVRALRFSVSDP